MDEKHYKETYSNINPNRCVFEKSINSRICNCSKSQRFNLADREGVACSSNIGLARCNQLIILLHSNARFALQRLDVENLGHAQEIKIQNGGLLGLQGELALQSQLGITAKNSVTDIDAIIANAEKEYKNIENFPYSKIMQVINAYSIRPKRVRLKEKNKVNTEDEIKKD